MKVLGLLRSDRSQGWSWAWCLALAAAYAVTGKLGLLVAFVGSNVSPVFPAAGVAVAALLLGGFRLLPGVWLGAFLLDVSCMPALVAAWAAAGNALGAAVVAALILGLDWDREFNQLRSVGVLFIGGTVGSLVPAANGIVTLFFAGLIPRNALPTAFCTWWLGDLMGILIVAPLVITWARKPGDPWRPWPPGRDLEVAGLLTVTVLVSCLVFTPIGAWNGSAVPVAFVVFPLVLWASVRFGSRGVTTTTLLVSAIAVAGSATGVGPFGSLLPLNQRLFSLDLLLGTASLSGLALSTALEERQSALAALQQASIALGQADDFIVLTDADGIITYANLAAQRGLGLDCTLRPRLADLEACTARAKPLLRAAVDAAIDSGKPWDLELPLVTTKRRPIWARARGSAVMANGKAIRLFGIFQDITARKHAESEAARLQARLLQAAKLESVGRLAGGVAHDFNNMLGVIIGHADGAMEHAEIAGGIHDDLVEIKNAAYRSASLTRQLLAFSRQQAVAPEVLDLSRHLTGMLRMLERLIGEGIRLTWMAGDKLWPISIDPSQLDQILTNLCINARDAITDVGTICVEIANSVIDEEFCAEHVDATPGEYIRLVVRDTGRGMTQETLAHIFEPFFTTKGIGEGTGLGLATVYGAVSQNGGFIDVSSEVGRGTAFQIYLPRHRGTAELEDAKMKDVRVPRGKETVLVVEDEPAILKLTTAQLDAQGYQVLKATSPDEAIRVSKEHAAEIHLLVTDVIMPGMNGRDLATVVAAHHPNVKRMFMSGYTADIIATRGKVGPGEHFLQKPFSKSDLSVKVREALDSKRD